VTFVDGDNGTTNFRCGGCERGWTEVTRTRVPRRPDGQHEQRSLRTQRECEEAALFSGTDRPEWALHGPTGRRLECRLIASSDRQWLVKLTLGAETLLAEEFPQQTEARSRAAHLKNGLVAKGWKGSHAPSGRIES